MEVLEYVASPTGSKFHLADDFVRAIMGPIGSGKSVTCIMDMLKHAVAQRPNKRGLRKTRWAVIRNTYRELIDTTVKTFFDWIPEHLGNYAKVDMQFTLTQMLPDGTVVQAEFLFRALDRPNDVKKLLSLEITGAFINEAKEVPRAVVEMAQGRCGRYPSKRDGGPTWFGLLMDTNPPDADHWWYKLFEETRPENHKLFRQPSGMSKGAENRHNLPPRYYENMMAGKDPEWINVFVHGRYGFVSDGRPVYPEYNDVIHYMEHATGHVNQPSTTIYVGIDFGLTPAAAIGYFTPAGQLIVCDELVAFNMGAVNFGQILHRVLSTAPYNKCTIEVYGDPAGEQRAQTDEMTPFLILANQGIVAYPVFTNDVSIRRESVARLLTQLDATGKPQLALTEKAKMLRKGFQGGYRYRRMQVTGSDRFMDKPDKNAYSHIHDALQYLVLGAIGNSHVIGGGKVIKLDYSRMHRGIV